MTHLLTHSLLSYYDSFIYLLYDSFLSYKSNTDYKVRESEVVVVHQLTNLGPMLYSYRNQSIDLQCKLINWFLYKWNIDLK